MFLYNISFKPLRNLFASFVRKSDDPNTIRPIDMSSFLRDRAKQLAEEKAKDQEKKLKPINLESLQPEKKESLGEADASATTSSGGDPKGGKSGPLQMQKKPSTIAPISPNPAKQEGLVKDQTPQSQWTDFKPQPITYTPPQTSAVPVSVPPVSQNQTRNDEAEASVPDPRPNQNQQSNGKGPDDYIFVEDKEHRLSSAELSEKHPGRRFFRTEGGWSTNDPAVEENKPEEKGQENPAKAQPTTEKPKPKKEEPLDVTTITPEQIKEVESRFNEFHRPPTEEEKQAIRNETDKQINDFINAVLSGKSNEASLPAMNKNEQIAFFIAMFTAERAKMVASIKITGRNRQKVAWAKELQKKIVTDLNNTANEHLNGAIKSISERKEKPTSFGGSLAEFTRDDKPITDQVTPENYVREYSSTEGDKSNWSYNRRKYTQGINQDDLPHEQMAHANNIRGAIFDAILEQSTDLPNTEVIQEADAGEGKSNSMKMKFGGTTVVIGNKPPTPNSNHSMVISFGLSSNTEQIKEAIGKILKALDKKDLGSILEIGSTTDIAMNSDNIRIKTGNWEDLQEVFKMVEKNLGSISGTDIHIEDNRYGMTEQETVELLADIKSQMKENNGKFKVHKEDEVFGEGEFNKLAKVALIAKMLSCKLIDNGDDTFSFQSVNQQNSSAYNNGVTINDSDDEVLQKIKDADIKDAQKPPVIEEDPNADVRKELPLGWNKAREQRTKSVKKPATPKTPSAPKPPATPKPVIPKKMETADLTLEQGEAPAEILPTSVGVTSYVPQIKDPSDLETEIDGVTDWSSPTSKNLIADFNSTLQNALDGYDIININYLKSLGEQINKGIESSGTDLSLTQDKAQIGKIDLWNRPASFSNRKGLVNKGVRGLFEVKPVQTKSEVQKIKQLVQFHGKGKDKTNGKFDPLNDGIWTDGKNGEYFTGWFETKDLDGESTVFVSSDNTMMFTVPKGKDDVARAFVKKNPYLATNENPIISNMEGYYPRSDFTGVSLPLTHTPDTLNLGQFLVKYPDLSLSHPDGRKTLTALLSYKHKLLSMMDPETRKIAITDGFEKAVNHLYKNAPTSLIKERLLDSKSEIEGSSNIDSTLNNDQKNIISSMSDEDFMKLLSSIQVERGNEESSKVKKFDSMREKERLTPANVEKYLKTKGLENSPILEYIANRPSGIFKMPQKGDTLYREIMDLPPHIRARLVGTKKDQTARKVTLDELAKDFSSGVHHSTGNQRYTGTGGTENFLNDVVSSLTDFYKENKTAEQAELDHYDSLSKKNVLEAKKMLSTPSMLSGKNIEHGNLYKIGGKVYMAVNDPDSSDWVFHSPEGDKSYHELFGDKDKIEIEGAIPKDTESWDTIGQPFMKKLYGEQETAPEEVPYKDDSMEDILNQDSYDPNGPLPSGEDKQEYNPLDDSDLPEEFREGNENFLSNEKKNKKASVKHRRGFNSLKGLDKCP
jgi:hypothetical protein